VIQYGGQDLPNKDFLKVIASTDDAINLLLPASLKEALLNGKKIKAIFLDGDEWKELPQKIDVFDFLNIFSTYEEGYPIEDFLYGELIKK